MSTTPTHRRLRIAGALAALATVALLAAAPAHAAGTTSAVCTNLFTITITPGFSMTPTSGTVTTDSGSITCVGKIDGHRVTGPGTMSIKETYTDVTCISSLISGTMYINVPTTAGDKDMEGALTVQRTALVVRPEARFPDARFSGVGVVVPTQGNCFATPLRKAVLSVTGTLTGA
ncbi:MAG: hypothetical protein M3401_09430 [Actinomycetota bacterium]|nr:hypothetical protein [Actinomycetota bacterium]